MKCQILFPWNSKKNNSKFRLPKILPGMQSVNLSAVGGTFHHFDCLGVVFLLGLSID